MTREPASASRVGAVVIGRNEGERLVRSLQALAGHGRVTVYADSNSSDGSRDAAQRLGAVVVHLAEGPCTPSRGREAGFRKLVELYPDVEYVQFLDGDCTIDPQWLERATAALDARPELAAVFGRRREERCSESLYSRLIDLDWDHPAGEVDNFGGDALVRVSAVQRAGGWSAETINAEDIDLSYRIRRNGGRILRMSDPMTSHDVRMTRFSEYWRRGVRAGYGYAEVGLRYVDGPGRALLRRLASSVLYVLVLPALLVVAGLAGSWLLAVLAMLLYVRVLGVMTLSSLRKGASLPTALTYAVLNLAVKAAGLLGALRFLADRAAGNRAPRSELVIYRRDPPKAREP